VRESGEIGTLLITTTPASCVTSPRLRPRHGWRRIVDSGGAELAKTLEDEGYARYGITEAA